MKKLLIGFTSLLLMLAACAPRSPMADAPTITVDEPTPTHVRVDLSPAQRAAIASLSETLRLPVDKITLVSTEAVTWRDGCLGVTRIGEFCTQAEVPGFKIVLEAEGKVYEFHTNQNGSVVLPAVAEQASAAVEEMVMKQLASNLGLNESDISVLSDAAIEFGDACLGVAIQDVMCAQVVTPGHIIVLEANGVQYEYHTNEDGTQIQPATLALTWKREGGIAGFCDTLTVFLSGEVYGNKCGSQPDGKMETFVSLFSASERKQFNAWVTKFGQARLDASDPQGVSDRMVIELVFYGMGSGTPGKAEEKTMITWAQSLYQKLYS